MSAVADTSSMGNVRRELNRQLDGMEADGTIAGHYNVNDMPWFVSLADLGLDADEVTVEWDTIPMVVTLRGTFRRPPVTHHDDPRPVGYFTLDQIKRMFGLKGRTGHKHRGTSKWAHRYYFRGKAV